MINTLWLAGAIWAFFCGWALSSYASNFIFRLPRHEYPFGREPYCGDCNASLTPRDLAPILSYAMTLGRCRHCGAKVPPSYFIIELLFPAAFVGFYCLWGLGDKFIIAALAFACLVVMVMMEWEERYYSPLTTTLLGFLGLLMQAVQTQTILNGLMAAFIAFIFTTGWHFRHQKLNKVPDMKSIPAYVWYATALGCWLPFITP